MKEMIRQMLMVGFPGTSLSHEMRNFVSGLGGAILFSENYESPHQIQALCSDLQSGAEEQGLPPLFISVDQEGGRVVRFKEPFTHFPPMRELGIRNSTKFATEFAQTLAKELKDVGVNVNFSPVLDVDSNPQNPIIGDRAISSDPNIVSSVGLSVIKGFHKEGILAVGKHFPGHGDTSKDSHITLPVVKKTKTELEKCEFIPFRHVIKNGLQAIMTAHVLYPFLDSQKPATVSAPILIDILRKEMKFDGIIFSDDMEMKALNQSEIVESAVSAVNAGVDILIIGHSFEKQKIIYEGLLSAAKGGKISLKRIEESYKRILEVKKNLLL